MTPKQSIQKLELLHQSIVSKLLILGEASPYTSDANEPDPRYLGYGVRAPEMKRLISSLKGEIKLLSKEEKITLAKRLIYSGYGEQKTVALAILEQITEYFSPEHFCLLDELIRSQHGWSKIDSYTKSFLPNILNQYEQELIQLLKQWNIDSDPWMRRASVVIFTRKVAKSRLYKDIALQHCEALKYDDEHLVQTGVGWCLRDLMRWHKEEILPYISNLRKMGVSSKVTLYALRDIKGEERAAILND